LGTLNTKIQITLEDEENENCYGKSKETWENQYEDNVVGIRHAKGTGEEEERKD
jgi:hypothetical protein